MLKETVTLKERTFLHICKPFTNSDDFSVEVEPGQSTLVKFRCDAEGRGEYNYNTKMTYILLESLADNEELLKEKAMNSPSKIKQREMHGHYMEVYIHTYFYYGGVAFLFINRCKAKTYVEDLELELTNLQNDEF